MATDTGDRKYSKKESFNRILRLIENKAPATDEPESLQGEILSEDGALSNLAELMADSLLNEDAILPPAFVASATEANADITTAINTRALTPLSHHYAHEYGGIYVATGTAQQAFTAATWTKITGAFQNYYNDSGAEVLSDWNDDRLQLNENGDWYSHYQLSLFAKDSASARIYIEAAIFLNATEVPSSRVSGYLGVSGSMQLSGLSILDNTSGYYADLRLRAGTTVTLNVGSAQFYVQKEVG